MARTGGDILIETLIEWGVDTIFGLPGDGINGVIEALRTRQDKIRFVQVRHEEASDAAESHCQASTPFCRSARQRDTEPRCNYYHGA
jgi:thiamine pyrophosphate-dependent acetolactate synthase large subunit-like protein